MEDLISTKEEVTLLQQQCEGLEKITENSWKVAKDAKAKKLQLTNKVARLEGYLKGSKDALTRRDIELTVAQK